MSERPWCEERVFGYNRIMGGERCSNRSKGQYNGKWLCGVHSPEARAKRATRREEKYQEHVRQSNVRGERHNYSAACVNAFHDPAGRTIATEDIAEGLVFGLYDALAALVTDTQEALAELDTNSADPLNEVPTIKNALTLLSSLKVQGPET